MALLKIARMGHLVLSRPAAAVADPTAPGIGLLLADMEETMLDAGGIGLAATQVHVPLRVVIFRVPPARADDPATAAGAGASPVALTRLINPEIEPLGDEQGVGWEACLSVPGLTGQVPRYLRIRYRGLAPDGSRVDRIAEGFHARVVQHETDHLDGILYPQRMRDLSTLAFVDEIQRSQAAAAARAANDEGAAATAAVRRVEEAER